MATDRRAEIQGERGSVGFGSFPACCRLRVTPHLFCRKLFPAACSGDGGVRLFSQNTWHMEADLVG